MTRSSMTIPCWMSITGSCCDSPAIGTKAEGLLGYVPQRVAYSQLPVPTLRTMFFQRFSLISAAMTSVDVSFEDYIV